jgi:LuxR family transcriptional regulator, maltose regulon positive regulatory protein
MGRQSLETLTVLCPKPAGVLPRERLFKTLDELRAHPMLWLGGPPGAGKTTLIASYLGCRRLQALWLPLEREDFEAPALFDRLELGRAPRTTRVGAGAVAGGRRLRELFDRLPPPGVWVLDDCHEVGEEAPLHAFLADAAAHIPAGSNLLLLGRGEPPSAYSRLIASGVLAVFDPRQLRLTPEETRAIARDFSSEARVLEMLCSECDGWAAGVTLALERLRRQTTDLQRLRADIHQALFGYFAGEIFDRSSQEERHILLSTALLPRFSAQMAQEVSGSAQAPTLLAKLAARQMFTTRTGSAPAVYEYTPLFREFLLSRAEEGTAATDAPLREARQRAADILERCGELEASAALRVRGRDWKGLQRLICQHGGRVLAEGRVKLMRRWIAAIPADFAAQSPWLTYWSGAAAIAESPVAARGLLDRAWMGFEARGDHVGELLTAAAVLETYQLEWSTYEPAGTWIDRLEASLAEVAALESVEARVRVLANWLFALSRIRPQSQRAAGCIAQLRPLLEADIEINQWLFAARCLLLAHCFRGDMEASGALVLRMRTALQDPTCAASTRVAALSAIAYSLSLSGTTAEAARLLQEASRAAGEQPLAARDPLHHETRQLLALANNDPEKLQENIRALRQVIEPASHYGMSLLSSALAQQAMLRGERAASLNHRVAAVSRADAAGALPLQRMSRLALAAALAEAGDAAEATRVLQQAQELEGEPPEPGRREHQLLSAYLALRRGQREACQALLTSTLASSHPRILACFPREMAELCLEALHAGIAADVARDLIKQYSLQPPSKSDDAWPWRFKVFVLGRFRLLKDDGPIRSSRRARRKPLELLQALIAFGGVEVGAGALTDALWPESEGDAGYHALESALYRLRQMLGVPEAITLVAGKLTLDPRQFWVDAWAFETELLTPPPRRAQPATRLQRMRQLYASHFLEHESEKSWALKSRQLLREKFVRSIREIARDYESRRLWQEAVHVYQTGIEVDSLAEDLHRGLILCHRELGDHVAALQAYRRCSELLNRVLGVPPTAKTLALYQSVRQAAVAAPG